MLNQTRRKCDKPKAAYSNVEDLALRLRVLRRRGATRGSAEEKGQESHGTRDTAGASDERGPRPGCAGNLVSRSVDQYCRSSFHGPSLLRVLCIGESGVEIA